MKFHFVDDELPELNVDVLCFYGADLDEFHVLYLSSNGRWYRRVDTDKSSFSPPDYWAELPSIEEVEG